MLVLANDRVKFWVKIIYSCLLMSNAGVMGFLCSSVVKNCLPMQETLVQSVGQEDIMKKEMATHSSILTWTIPWAEVPGKLHFMGLQRVGLD